MSLLPHTLLNSTNNEDQTLEIHSEILEPLSHSQNITRWEIPHKNVLDSDSQLIYKVYWNNQSVNSSGTDHLNGATMVARPYLDGGLYSLINRARLYVNGVIISELNEVGKWLALKKNFIPHEVKTEKTDFFSYADHELNVTDAGQIFDDVAKVKRVPGDKELGAKANNFEVEASIRLGDLFGILEGSQLDTNSILGKIMIEIDWYKPNNYQNCSYTGSGVQANDKGLEVAEPRLILDFLTFNDEVTGALRDTIFGDGPGVTMPFREVALVRKVTNSNANADAKSEDHYIGMTGRAVQKLWIQKVMNSTAENDILGPNRSDLLQDQRWNLKVNDLMIFDRDVQNRAEEFNYLEQAGEKQFTCPPSAYEDRSHATKPGYVANNNYYNANANSFLQNTSNNNHPTGDIGPYSNGRYFGANAQTFTTPAVNRMGRQNYLGVNLAKYGSRETALNAIRVGSTPIIYNLQYNGANDADTSAVSGTLYFFVEYLKVMNLKNGEINVMDM